MRSNKVRTALTGLGIVIGISAVIIVFSAGEGIRSLVLGQVESFGSNFISIETKVPSTKSGAGGESQSGAAMAQGVQVTTLKLEDMDDINKLPNVTISYAGLQGQDQASYGSEIKKVLLFGVSATFPQIDNGEIDNGRFFTEDEDKSISQVVVLGSKIKDKLFGDADPIGKYITLHRSKYRVVGVMKPRGSSGIISLDDFVYLPVQTLQKKIMGIDHILSIVAQLKDTSLEDETAEDIKYVLRHNHDITNPDKDDFRVTTMEEIMSTLDTITGALTLLLLAIVAISLIVGGVGILNIMYVAVTERTAEIGLRKAVGAKYKDIMLQFLVESTILTLLGGISGIIIGSAISGLIAFAANNILGISWDFIIPLRAFVVAIVFSLVFGIFFGVYPARKAAKLDPIEALRSE
ncbi:MAG: hypothetical protein UT48_C0025G0008 [Parcubacteria group bacterium GW2011_GWE2_39_37]|nr:MAG: hypothetical protein UT48_C0025G0008 [Parcubacteria group bacterium GW2011_GWE2_39_37]